MAANKHICKHNEQIIHCDICILEAELKIFKKVSEDCSIENQTLIDLLKKIEWSCNCEGYLYFPYCGECQEGGHNKDCELQEAIRKSSSKTPGDIPQD